MKLLYAFLPSFGIRTFCTNPQITKPLKPLKPKTSFPETLKWTDQQLQVLESAKRRESIFITGSAGTGKTKLVEQIIKVLRKIHGKNGVYVTASTGVAACALNGQTLHSFAGVGLAERDSLSLLARVFSDKKALKRWKNTKALVIDEISMIDGDMFDKLEFIARRVMSGKFDSSESELTWGGIQLVVSGDFFQLPPIGNKYATKFAFEANCWYKSFQFQVSLHSVFRQSDLEYVRILEGIRKGILNPQDKDFLEKRCCDNEEGLDETVVRLFPRNEDVGRVNETRLRDLEEEVVSFEAFDTGKEPWKSQLNQGIAPSSLKLCKGARVMLTKNMNVKSKLVNGATGVVTRFVNLRKGDASRICRYPEGTIYPVVEFDSGGRMVVKPNKWGVMEGDQILAERMQLPLMLAWATSIHKSQGMTLDKLYTNLSRSFGYGMNYVALSRVKCLDGLFLSGFRPSSVKAHPKVLAFYKKNFE